MRRYCKVILQLRSQGVEIRVHIERVWKEEQNAVIKISLENTLTKCYTRFRSTLECQWETCHGYPVTLDQCAL